MISIISSPGHMATRWIAECFSRNDELLVTHANAIIKPERDITVLLDGDSVVERDKEFIQKDWPMLESAISVNDILTDYLEDLRVKHKKKRIVAIHSAPISCGNYYKDSLEKRNGNFVYLVREPIQKIDSQMSKWKNFDVMPSIRRKK